MKELLKLATLVTIQPQPFKNSLLQANFDDALTIYNAWNINLRCPFLNVKTSEVM